MFCCCSLYLGVQAAQEMYGCKDPEAWVAHGFTDGDLSGFPYGDNQWALCVTCGSWAALTLWEQLLHEPVSVKNAALLRRVVASLRGVAKFFVEYMWAEETGESGESPSTESQGDASSSSASVVSSSSSVVHTGPTTSPENSYLVIYIGGTFSYSLYPVCFLVCVLYIASHLWVFFCTIYRWRFFSCKYSTKKARRRRSW
jgi:hypothetical protein